MTTERSALDQALLEQVAALVNESTRQTSLLSELRGLSLNDVIWSGTKELDAGGMASINASTTYAYFSAWALDGDVTATNATEASDAPAAGVGVFPIPAGEALGWPLVGSGFTLYGTPGDRVIVALYTKMRPPFVANGVGSFDGGGA